MAPGGVETSLRELISTFNDLNASVVEELDEEPSPLEFMRFVSRNTPFVVRGGASNWQAVQCWNADYLVSALQGQTVNVAVTPHGNADSPTFSPAHGVTLLAKPLEEDQPFREFLAYINEQEISPGFPDHAEVRYSQTQNDNFRNEYLPLFSDALKDIPFARIALQKAPEAINMWIGNSQSTTALHRDPMENIYVQVLGMKHFVLLPPLCQPCVNEQFMPAATYTRVNGELVPSLDEGGDAVPFATWDPDDPLVNQTAFSHLAKPLRITLHPGDMLYLPALWYHKVSQSCTAEDEGFIVAINYWYDMDYSGPLYPVTNFFRALKEDGTNRPHDCHAMASDIP